MWASVTFMPTRQTNPRTEPQFIQRRQCSEFAGNGTREFIRNCSNRMERKCEQARHSLEKDKSIHVQRYNVVNDVSAPSLLGMEPVSWFQPVQIEWWQANVSKHDIHMKKTNQSTYRASVQSTTSVLRVCSEWSPWVDYTLLEHNGKEMWNVSKTNQSTYRATDRSTTEVIFIICSLSVETKDKRKSC